MLTGAGFGLRRFFLNRSEGASMAAGTAAQKFSKHFVIRLENHTFALPILPFGKGWKAIKKQMLS